MIVKSRDKPTDVHRRQKRSHSTVREVGEGASHSHSHSPYEVAPPRRAVSVMASRQKSDIAEGRPSSKGTTGNNSFCSDDMSAAPPPVGGSLVSYFSQFLLPENCQAKVVDADIERSLWSLFPQENERNEKRKMLKEIILRVLAHHPECYYYQGLHELMGFVLYVTYPYTRYEKIVSLCEQLLLTRWWYYCERKLSSSEALLYAAHAVVVEVDPKLAAQLETAGVGPESHYAVSWVITWYVHCLQNTTVLARLFDYFMVEEDGLNVIFFTAALVVWSKETIKTWITEAMEMVEGDEVAVMGIAYSKLSGLPKTVLEDISSEDLEELLLVANGYRDHYLYIVQREKKNFLDGNIRKLGILANRRTRNVALRIIWHLLPREWRTPVAEGHAKRALLISTGLMLASTAFFMSKKHGL
ncbi:GTPase activating protein of Rab-like GTPase [Angomonas deanei]|uniref:Rab-GTPase-TBC domain containing protein, putative n=1 Tax=Angomonas deanei TaxID=59799 RepID=A0A7G2C5R3_9TRYP|nr:GTPase activating protein of Rab-like GTPase [Angomonas deanei]CAD2215138.1 Rab-GTPase-TBC domain containing protein, putative [Angomonas deanei]|eukprot:EPY40999.1 GTPase activating protein of Rab-like GTPase [Angomonas deanei]